MWDPWEEINCKRKKASVYPSMNVAFFFVYYVAFYQYEEFKWYLNINEITQIHTRKYCWLHPHYLYPLFQHKIKIKKGRDLALFRIYSNISSNNYFMCILYVFYILYYQRKHQPHTCAAQKKRSILTLLETKFEVICSISFETAWSLNFEILLLISF